MFHIGQKVVCIKNHSENIVRKGQEYIIRNLTLCPNCKGLNVDVGITLLGTTQCTDCGYIDFTITSIWWFSADLFAPLTEEKGTTYIWDYIEITKPAELQEIQTNHRR